MVQLAPAPSPHHQQQPQPSIFVGTLRGAGGQMTTPVPGRHIVRHEAVAAALKLQGNAQVASTGIPTAMANTNNPVVALTPQQQVANLSLMQSHNLCSCLVFVYNYNMFFRYNWLYRNTQHFSYNSV